MLANRTRTKDSEAKGDSIEGEEPLARKVATAKERKVDGLD